MDDYERVRNEEENNGKDPQNHMGVTGFDGGSEELGDNDDQDLCEDQVEQSEFFAEGGAVGLDFGLGCFQGRVVGDCHGALQIGGQNSRPFPPKDGGKERGTPRAFLFLFCWF